MKTWKKTAAVFGLALGLALSPCISIAGDDHLEEAIEDTNDALNLGRQGEAEKFIEHAQEALEHAEALLKEKDNMLTNAAIRDLKTAIEQAKAGKVSEAVEAAQLALGHLKHAK